MGHFLKPLLGLAASAMVICSFMSPAAAGCEGRYCDDERYADAGGDRYVTSQATFGGRTVTAPVRSGRRGEQVLIPGGSWVDCEITCEYTLRRLTVDFWDGMGKEGFVSPGYFRYDFDLDTGETYRRGPALFGRY